MNLLMNSAPSRSSLIWSSTTVRAQCADRDARALGDVRRGLPADGWVTQQTMDELRRAIADKRSKGQAKK
jgi:hypothetical protein